MKKNIPDNYSLLLDYKGLFSVFWKDKYLVLVMVLLSIPFGINYINNKPPIYSAQAIIDVSETSNKVAGGSMLSPAMPIFQFEKQSISFLPKVTGNEFLKSVLLKNEKIEKRVKETCGFSKGEISFLRRLLIRSRMSLDVDPNAQQKEDMLINCVKDMLLVKEYTHDGSFKTPAHTLSIEASDPFFAADLVNEIVEKFFAFQQMETKEYFKKLSRQLSSMMEDALLALNEKEERLEAFTIKHAGLIGKNSSYVQQGTEDNSLRFALRSQIYKLGQSEKYDVDLKDLIYKLGQVSTEDVASINNIVQTIGITGGLSSEFVSAMSEAQKSPIDSVKEKRSIKKKFENEITRLNDLLKQNERQLADKEVKVASLIELSNELNRLEMEVKSKKAYISTLETQMATNALETGLMKLKEGQMLSKATPPVYPIGPNKKRIMALFFIAFAIIGVSISLLKQSINNKVYHVGQLQKLGSFGNLVQASLRRRLFFGIFGNREKMKSQFDFKFFSDLMSSGRIGCVVDVRSNGNSRFNAAEEIAAQIGSTVFKKEKSILLFKKGPKDSLSLNSENKKRNSYLENQTKSRAGEENLFVERVDKATIENLSGSSLISQFKEYDRVVVSLDHTVDDIVKMKLMSEVNYYILVGIGGIVDMKTIRKFVQISGEEKCLGICIID